MFAVTGCICCCSIPVVLVGNKNDLQNDRVVSVDEGKKLASEWNVKFLETSAKEYQASSYTNLSSQPHLFSNISFFQNIVYKNKTVLYDCILEKYLKNSI